jgi:hypothetical protein
LLVLLLVIGVVVLSKTRLEARREVLVWLGLGVFFAVIGVLIKVWQGVSQGNPFSFPLATAAELDLPAVAIAGGALGQHVIRRGMPRDSSNDLVVFGLGILALVAGLEIWANPPSEKFSLAVPSHIVVFGLAVFVGAYSVYLCAPQSPPPNGGAPRPPPAPPPLTGTRRVPAAQKTTAAERTD